MNGSPSTGRQDAWLNLFTLLNSESLRNRTSQKLHLRETRFIKNLLAPVTPKVFAERYFENRHLYNKNSLLMDPPPFSFKELGTALERREYPLQQLRIFNREQKEIVESLEKERILKMGTRAFRDEKYSFVLNSIDTVKPRCFKLRRSFEEAFDIPFQINCYVTPKGAQTLKLHYDTHDVFVFQIAGVKTWTLWNRYLDMPTRTDAPAVDPKKLKGKTKISMAPMSMLYIPRGQPHVADETVENSMHLTIGLRPILAIQLLQFAVNQVLDDCQRLTPFRHALLPDANGGFQDVKLRMADLHAVFSDGLANVPWDLYLKKQLYDFRRQHNLPTVDWESRMRSRLSDSKTVIEPTFAPYLVEAEKFNGKILLLANDRKIVLPKRFSRAVDALLQLKNPIVATDLVLPGVTRVERVELLRKFEDLELLNCL